MIPAPRRTRVTWPKTYRIIRSIHPPIALFEDIADPADWELIASAEAKTNPRVHADIGRLDLVPVERRLSGPGASWTMAPFVHCSTDRPTRFSDGSFGVYYASDRIEVALLETAYHHGRFMAATAEPECWTSQFRELVGSLDASLHDVTAEGFESLLDPDDYTEAQAFGRDLRGQGSDGVLYPSVRCAEGRAVGLLWPDVAGLAVQARHFAYHWSGEEVDMVRELPDGPEFRLR